MPDEQDRAEAVDEDNVDRDFPPDRPLGVEDPTHDESVEDSLADRVRREERPSEGDGADAAAAAVRPLAEDDALDEEDELVADVGEERQPETDGVPDPAEEAALHLEVEP